MSTQMFGAVSGGLVIASGFYYLVNTWRGTSCPNITSWALWTIIGLALLITYRSSGAEDNVWPAVFGFTNPLMIAILAIWKRGRWEKLSIFELICVVCCFVSLALWIELRTNKELVQYALYVAIVADLWAAIPTILFVWKHPEEERPLPWLLFAIGYAIAILAVTESTFANYSLIVYMSSGTLVVAFPIIRYCYFHRPRLLDWI